VPKRFAFLAGLPRSGSTLLSGLLSQRPDVHISLLSDTHEVLRYAHSTMPTKENYRAGEVSSRNDLLTNALSAMYASKDVALVIDKSRVWGTPYFRNVLREALGEDPRIIAPIRPLTEIVASFIRLCDRNPNNYIDAAMVAEDFHSYWRKPIGDARTDWLLLPNGHLGTAMLSLYGAYQPESAACYLPVPYADLCTNTLLTLKGIEDFLEIPPFDYQLDSITGPASNDEQVYGAPDMHYIRPVIGRVDPDPRAVLSDYSLARCELEDFWT